MVKMTYVGVSDAKRQFEALRPLHKDLMQMQMKCRPFGPDYLILSAATTALHTAAYHFTGEPDFYSSKSPG
jgi:hypothetical protein